MFEEKPLNLELREFLIKVIAKKMELPEDAVTAVINHQFKNLSKAMLSSQIVELSGFGRFIFSVKKAEKALIKTQELIDSLPEDKREPKIEFLNELKRRL